jgi:hypothetical protein
MDVAFWLSVGGILVSSLVAIGVVALGALFAGQQAHLGRTWERKAEAYSAILEALHEMEEWFSQALDDEYVRRDVDDATSATRAADYRAARKLLRRTIAREIWLLPSAVQDRAAALNKVLTAHYDSWFEDIDAGCFEVRKSIADIAEMARGDLNKRKKLQRTGTGPVTSRA